MGYLYETHLHTTQGSACGRSAGKDYVRFYKDHGYTGIFVTDHFYLGNCRPSRGLPWKTWVYEFCKGYDEAYDEGIRLGLDVFFGWETTYDGDDYLIYGPDPIWLSEHPEIVTWNIPEQHAHVRAAGGAVIQAHPFRERGYINTVNLHPYAVDGWEAANRGNIPWMNALAYRYAKNHGMLMTAGSDIHEAIDVEIPTFGVEVDHRLVSSVDYAQTILSGKGIKMHVPENYFETLPIEESTLPIHFFDADNHMTVLEKAPE